MSKKTKIFVCCNEKKKGRCGDNGGEEFKKNLKLLLDSENLNEKFKVKSAGCLGKCSKGVACQIGEEKPIKNLGVLESFIIIEHLKSYKRTKTVA